LFGKGKPESAPPSGKGFVPVERVKELSSKGFSEPEIIDVLRKEGYSPEEIDKAMTEALKTAVTEEEKAPAKLPTLEEIKTEAPTPAAVTLPGAAEPEAPAEAPTAPAEYYYPAEEYSPEEIVEPIIEEKTSEIERKLLEFKTQYSNLDRKIGEIRHRLDLLAKGRTREEEELLTKIDVLKDNLEEISGKVSSLEKAFKETLPALIESVRALSDLVQRLKKEV
jgi:DNA-binding transcriptional MerR regulator